MASFKGQFPNWLVDHGFKGSWLHDGVIYSAFVEPHQAKRGDVVSLQFVLQSCYVGPVEVIVQASSHSAIKNQKIGAISAQLGPLEVAKVTIQVEVPPTTRAGKKQIDFHVFCKPFKDVKKITELDVKEGSEDFGNVVRSAKKLLGGWMGTGKGLRSDSGAMWMKMHYEVLNETASEARKAQGPTLTTIWPTTSQR